MTQPAPKSAAAVARKGASAVDRRFPCAGCGAMQTFRPGARALACEFCGDVTPIPQPAGYRPRERPLAAALAALAEAGTAAATAPATRTGASSGTAGATAAPPPAAPAPATATPAPPAPAGTTPAPVVSTPGDDGDAPQATSPAAGLRCTGCAALVRLPAVQSAGECPFCGTALVVGPRPTGDDPADPRSLVPFVLDEGAARDAFRAWLGSRRFVPAGLRRHARVRGSLHGAYLPWWTYDSSTRTAWTGERGDAYYVTVPASVTRHGRQVSTTRRERRVRWRRVSGVVSRVFDDVLVGASRSLPRLLLDRLGPWRLEALVPWDARYLSGFRSEVSQVDLAEGFELARQQMEHIIRADVARAIGGDHQRIHTLRTTHSATTFKHLLLPVWWASFEFRGRRYHFAVNGQTGKVQGERPWSWLKVLLAGALGLAALAGLVWLLQRTA